MPLSKLVEFCLRQCVKYKLLSRDHVILYLSGVNHQGKRDLRDLHQLLTTTDVSSSTEAIWSARKPTLTPLFSAKKKKKREMENQIFSSLVPLFFTWLLVLMLGNGYQPPKTSKANMSAQLESFWQKKAKNVFYVFIWAWKPLYHSIKNKFAFQSNPWHCNLNLK